MKFRPLLILALLVAAVVGAAVWFLQTAPPVSPLPEAFTASPAPLSAAAATAAPSPTLASSANTITAAPAPASSPRPIAEWETKIDNVLRINSDNSEAGNAATVQMLLNLMPTLPPEGQAEAAQHISNLLEDKDYARVLPIVKNPQTPEDVLDVFVTDLMNRDDSVKLPTLLEIAKVPNHPHQEEAKTDLEIFLDDDFGTNWPKWDAAMKDYLKKQAADNAEDATVPAAKK